MRFTDPASWSAALLLWSIVLLCRQSGIGHRSPQMPLVDGASLREVKKERALETEGDKQQQQPKITYQTEDNATCWIFTHLQKCGGSTIKQILHVRWATAMAIYDSPQWLAGNQYTAAYGDKVLSGDQWNVVAGGYPEALRPYVAHQCKWFTMFRHPVSRLVSAYFYCQELPNDQACASNAVHAKDVDLVTFAKHWGNFAVRQFALNFVNIEDVLAYAAELNARKTEDAPDDLLDSPGWYLLKLYLDAESKRMEGSSASGDGEGGGLPDRALYELLPPIQNMLRDGMAAVGILEEFDDTLELFNRALGMPQLDWRGEFADEGVKNIDKVYAAQKTEALKEAWTNAEIKEYIWLDLLLYEHAVDVFNHQKIQYGMEH